MMSDDRRPRYRPEVVLKFVSDTLSKVAEMFSEIASSHVTLFVVET